MIIVTQNLVATMFLNHLVMTTTPVLMTTVILLHANVYLTKFPAMIMTHVPMMTAALNLVANTGILYVTITMNVLVIHVILPLVVYMKIFLTNVKPTTNVTRIIVILKLDVLMI